MVALSFLSSLLLVSLASQHAVRASPVFNRQGQAPTSVTVNTPLGPASGVPDSNTVGRFAVKYASANRWQKSSVVTKWQLPNNSTDPSALPLACIQPPSAENSSNQDEDCLSMILYVPEAAMNGKVPTLMWIHGGSFILGSATGPGLDGGALAQATGSIVAVIQYRLGVLGFLSPSGQSNLAVQDTITALQFLQKVLPSFNGDTSKVTIAGQSSGAHMVRALLATPSASSLFARAILQSDPSDYGFLSPGAFQTINNFFVTQLPCSASDTSCLNSIDPGTIVDLTMDVFVNAMGLDASAGNFEPMRPVHDGSLINTPLDSTAPFPHVSKPILLSTVRTEAGPAIFQMFGGPVSASDYLPALNSSLGEPRSSVIAQSSFYSLPPSLASNSNSDVRPQLVTVGTDQIWRCATWAFARLYQQNGGKVYVGEYVVGATYPDNEPFSFCTSDGAVCHEDDIYIVFGTAPNPTSAQSNLIKEMQARYKSFLSSGNPNANGFPSWSAVSGSNVNALQLGGNGAPSTGGCDPSFWGKQVLFDYQMFGI